jgi:phage terminase large subunit GpA-like protein
MNNIVIGQRLINSLSWKKAINLDEWAEKNFVLESSSAIGGGYYNFEYAPAMRLPLQAISYNNLTYFNYWLGSQFGKALSLDTDILTDSGFVKMGDLKVGDTLFDEKGQKCKVTFATEVMNNHKCYEVCFDNNRKVIADAEHLWEVEERQGHGKSEIKVMTTQQIIDNGLKLPNNGARYSIKKQYNNIEFDSSSLKVDPYTLGIWLGDGSKNSGVIHSNSDDCIQIQKQIKYKSIIKKYKGMTENSRSIRTRGLLVDLREIGVLGNKHIPDEYLYNTYENRIRLIQGLMDSDGYCRRSNCEFVNLNIKMADDLSYLLSSIGLKPRTIYKDGKYARVTFTAYKEDKITTLKKCTYKNRGDKSNRSYLIDNFYIRDITQTKSVPVRCIQVDSDSKLFLITKSLIPTHNTTLAMVALNYFIDIAPSNIAFFLPNDNLVSYTATDRILPAIQRTPNGKMVTMEQELSKKRENTKNIRFSGGVLRILSANSETNRKSFPAKYIFIDETAVFGKSHIEEIEERGKTFEQFGGKIIKTSTSNTSEDSCVTAHKKSECVMEYHVKCPDCGESHVDDFIENIGYEKLDGDLENEDFLVKYITHATNTAYYKCPHCNSKWDNDKKNAAVKNGKWEAIRGHIKTAKSISFRASSLLSGLVTINTMVDKYLKVKDNDDLLSKFYNGWLSKIFTPKKRQKSTDELLPLITDLERAEIPEGNIALVGTVDVQKDHYYYSVIAFQEGVSLHIVDYGRVESETDLQFKILQGYQIAQNELLYPEIWAIDSGYDTKNIYDLVDHLNSLNEMAEYDPTIKDLFDKRDGMPLEVIPIKGANRAMSTISHITSIESDFEGKKYSDSLKLHTINVELFKDNAWSYIERSLDEEYEGKKRLSLHSESDESILKSYISEYKAEVTNKRGVTTYAWTPIESHPFNHYWDCLVYALYLGEKLEVRFRKPLVKKIVQAVAPPPKREKQEEYIAGEWMDEY